jgi:hypothetical protein
MRPATSSASSILNRHLDSRRAIEPLQLPLASARAKMPVKRTKRNGSTRKKERRVYLPRVLGSGQVMMPADLKRLHKYMPEIEHISVVSESTRRGRRGMARACAQAAAEETAES